MRLSPLAGTQVDREGPVAEVGRLRGQRSHPAAVGAQAGRQVPQTDRSPGPERLRPAADGQLGIRR